MYRYNYNGQVHGISVELGGTKKTLIYDLIYKPFGPVTSWKWGNGTSYLMDYDKDYRLTGIKTSLPGKQDLRFDYDQANNIIEITNNTNRYSSQTFKYTDDYRLRSISSLRLNESYTYDSVGNRERKNSTVYDYERNSNRLASVGDSSYQYDTKGNIINANGKRYKYDAFNRMIEATTSYSKSKYGYNALGQRVYKIISSKTPERFVYSVKGELIYEPYNKREYIYFNGNPIGFIKNNRLYYVLNDQVGRPEMLLNERSAIAWQANLGPFHRSIKKSRVGHFNLGFPGQYWDKEKGSYYNMFRDYDPEIGRYLQSDPIGLAGGMNTYAYALSNPVRYTDPLGLDVLICNRKVGGFPFVGNHAYAWDTTTNQSASMRGSSGAGMEDGGEAGPSKDSCNAVKGSAGKEKDIMSFLNKNKNNGMWTQGQRMSD